MDLDQPDETDDLAPDTPAEGGSSWGIAAIGLVVGLVIAGVIIVTTGGDDDDATPPPTVSAATTPTTVSDSAEQNGDATDLVVAYGRSRTEDHALSGELLRPDTSALSVRRAIMGGRAIDEVGSTAAVTEDGQTRQCELIDGQWLCSPPLPEITAERDVQGFATLLLTEDPTYSVFAVSAQPPEALTDITELGAVTCWSMVSAGRVDRARFGAETTMCFHDEIGALVGRVTETSAGDDLFIADELTAEVEVADVEPSR